MTIKSFSILSHIFARLQNSSCLAIKVYKLGGFHISVMTERKSFEQKEGLLSHPSLQLISFARSQAVLVCRRQGRECQCAVVSQAGVGKQSFFGACLSIHSVPGVH